jgi:hypothetical protein
LIVRTWRATASSAGGENYRRYFAETLLPRLRDLPGFAGGYLLGRELDDAEGIVELTAHTFWQSEGAIRAFAGDDISVSIVEPEARAFLLACDTTAAHRIVWVDGRS